VELSVPLLGLLILAAAVLIVGALQLYLSHTRAGAVWRAASQDPEVAGLVGIDARAVYVSATAVAVAIAAVGGVFLAVRVVPGWLRPAARRLFDGLRAARVARSAILGLHDRPAAP
jgi:branched-subunit amino acid ABC-type transport system permease component